MNRLHLSVPEFYDMTPVEFYYATQDYDRLETIRMQEPIKAIYEAMRIQTMFIANMNPYVKKVYKKPQDLFALSWDKKTPPKKQSVEEMRAVLLSFASRQNKKQKN